MRSSYLKNNYGMIFDAISFIVDPKIIVEFGILDGYSLEKFAMNCPNSSIFAYDLFEDFPFNHANLEKMQEKFSVYPNVKINKADFYVAHELFDNDSIDLLHIDIANDGKTFEHAIEFWTPKVKKIIILEGGSLERDNVYWMKQYQKPKIGPVIEKFKKSYKIHVIEEYPSVTILQKNTYS